MDNNLEEVNVSVNTDDEFLGNINSILAVKKDYERKEYNYSWIAMIEETLPYLDNIVRNPKRFIVNEEEIVKVELARKVTVESVIHLTQHTNLIQDIDKKTGDVRPSKILNINKDENLDTYENRFIYTLINNLTRFFNERKENISDESYYYNRKNFSYKANTYIGTEKINIALELSSNDEAKTKVSKETGLTISERLKAIKIQLDGFSGSELMQTLSKLHVPPVRSPIRKTNVILKNPNFQKAEQLWNYLQSYDQDDCKYEKDAQDYLDMGELKKQYDQSFLYAYLANKNLAFKEKKLTEKGAMRLVIDCLIRNIFDYNLDLDEKEINALFQKRLKKAKIELDSKSKKIEEALIENMNRTNKIIEDSFSIFD